MSPLSAQVSGRRPEAGPRREAGRWGAPRSPPPASPSATAVSGPSARGIRRLGLRAAPGGTGPGEGAAPGGGAGAGGRAPRAARAATERAKAGGPRTAALREFLRAAGGTTGPADTDVGRLLPLLRVGTWPGLPGSETMVRSGLPAPSLRTSRGGPCICRRPPQAPGSGGAGTQGLHALHLPAQISAPGS